jgi:hypothetical protein
MVNYLLRRCKCRIGGYSHRWHVGWAVTWRLTSAFRFASGHVSRTVRRSFLSVPPTKVDYEYEDDGNTALLLRQPVRLPISPLALAGY